MGQNRKYMDEIATLIKEFFISLIRKKEVSSFIDDIQEESRILKLIFRDGSFITIRIRDEE